MHEPLCDEVAGLEVHAGSSLRLGEIHLLRRGGGGGRRENRWRRTIALHDGFRELEAKRRSSREVGNGMEGGHNCNVLGAGHQRKRQGKR